MSELNKFKGKLQADKKLQKKMSEASTIKDVVQIASDAGCNVTEKEVKDDIMTSISGGTDVGSAGFGLGGLLGSNGDLQIGDVGVSAFDISRIAADVHQIVSGAGSQALVTGNINVNKGR